MKKETKMIRLAEERGVAVSGLKKEIDKIAKFIRLKVYNEYNRHLVAKLNFEVPSEICNVFPFLGELTINVEARLYVDNTFSGGGSFGPKGSVDFSQDLQRWIDSGVSIYDEKSKKMYHCSVNVICYYNYEGKVWLNSVLTTLYHELNHAYDLWVNNSKNGNIDRYLNTSQKSAAGYDLINVLPAIGTCIYRLFSETEYNALVASVFGDLQGRDSGVDTFRYDYKKTQAYMIYSQLKKSLESEVNNLDNEVCRYLYQYIKLKNIYLPMRRKTISSFKKAFLKKANLQLNKLLFDIGRTASLYYDKKEEEKNNMQKNGI